ncbi:MAG: hypothetical protein HXL34_07970, partial [Prevotellaceae bacterium]|nr:hypothetical protein [Prevotellaceae bacterium]
MIENKKYGFRAVILQATLLLLPVTSAFFAGSCRMAPKDNPGDTVASAEFYPPDTTQINRLHRADSTAMARRPDSINVFYVGEGSTRRELQLVSYPSRRDTVVRFKARHIRVEGRADVGSVVRIKLWA